MAQIQAVYVGSQASIGGRAELCKINGNGTSHDCSLMTQWRVWMSKRRPSARKVSCDKIEIAHDRLKGSGGRTHCNRPWGSTVAPRVEECWLPCVRMKHVRADDGEWSNRRDGSTTDLSRRSTFTRMRWLHGAVMQVASMGACLLMLCSCTSPVSSKYRIVLLFHGTSPRRPRGCTPIGPLTLSLEKRPEPPVQRPPAPPRCCVA